MHGLPETFDIAKRVSFFLYFPKKINDKNYFDDIFHYYQNEFTLIKNDLMIYRSKCNNDWSKEKCRLGQPKLSAKTSFSKYMRVAHGMNLIEMKRTQDSWVLNPTSMTYIIKILSKIYQAYDISFFELSIPIKLFFTDNLLKRDAIFTIPILKSLKEVEVSSQTGFLNKEFLEACANNLFNFSSDIFNTELIEDDAARSYVKRLKFLERNQIRLKNKNIPTRGFLHIIEPRIHWFIDLILIDYYLFCEEGQIRPFKFLFGPIDQPINQQHEILMEKYFDYLLSLNEINAPLYSQNKKTLDEIIDLAIEELRKYYPKLIPLESAITLIQIMGSITTSKYIMSKNIFNKLTEKYVILRDWKPMEGFLDVGSI